MERIVLLATMFVVLAVVPAETAAAQTARAGATTEFSAQARPRTRLRVTPGQLLYRDCRFKLVQEVRPSGTYIVPRQRCWWVRG